MSTKTNCEKCIFADYANSTEPCAMGVLEHISNHKTINTEESGFLSILQFRCPFAFSADVYKQHQQEIGSIDDLKHQLISRATINYYMLVIASEDNIDNICQTVQELSIKPKFISIVVHQSNDTETIIQKLHNLTSFVPWKLHNILEDNPSQQDILDTVLATNTNTQTSNYLWVNNDKNIDKWGSDVISINKTIVLSQPTLHAMFRKDTDGLFIGLHNYEQLIKDKKTDIITAITGLENPLLHYYA